MSTKTLPPSVSPQLLRSLTAREFLLVVAVYGMMPVIERMKVGLDPKVDADDLRAWELLVHRVAQAEAQRTAATK